jgi:hypothetical protein
MRWFPRVAGAGMAVTVGNVELLTDIDMIGILNAVGIHQGMDGCPIPNGNFTEGVAGAHPVI